MKQTFNKKSNNTSQNLSKGLYQPKMCNFLCKSDKTKKRKIKPRKQKPIKSVPTLKSISKSHTEPKRGKHSGLQMDKQFRYNQIPTFSHSETNAVELFLRKKEKSSPNEFFKVTSRKCASFCLFPWRLIGGRRGLFLYSPPLEQDTIRC